MKPLGEVRIVAECSLLGMSGDNSNTGYARQHGQGVSQCDDRGRAIAVCFGPVSHTGGAGAKFHGESFPGLP
jgi:hypothetical protein